MGIRAVTVICGRLTLSLGLEFVDLDVKYRMIIDYVEGWHHVWGWNLWIWMLDA